MDCGARQSLAGIVATLKELVAPLNVGWKGVTNRQASEVGFVIRPNSKGASWEAVVKPN